jgi:hypothetical protein
MIQFLAISAALAGPLPDADFPHGGTQRHADVSPSFGADISLGFAQGYIVSPWVERGGYGALIGRYEAFARSRSAPGPRIGASIWASQTMGKHAIATEPVANGDVQEIEVEMTHYGAMAVIRHAPEAPIGATMGFGFGRADIEDYYDGPLTLPVLSFEAGARHRGPHHSFVDWMARAHWAASRSTTRADLDEWWMIQITALVGFHAN